MTARRILPPVLFVLLCLGVGWINGLVTQAALDGWYPTLVKPSWTPPRIVFPIAWTILYVLMGSAAGLVWRSRQRDRLGATGRFLVHLACNALWSPVFFGLHWPAGGLVVIALMLATLVATIVAFFRVSRPAGWLLVPYLFWVGYATTVNVGVCWLNR